MQNQFTKGPWKINHWTQGASGVICKGSKEGINYFSGDAVGIPKYRIVSNIKPTEHSMYHSFEGAHIAEIDVPTGRVDGEAMTEANVRLMAMAPDMFAAIQLAQEYITMYQDGSKRTAIESMYELHKVFFDPALIAQMKAVNKQV